MRAYDREREREVEGYVSFYLFFSHSAWHVGS